MLTAYDCGPETAWQAIDGRRRRTWGSGTPARSRWQVPLPGLRGACHGPCTA